MKNKLLIGLAGIVALALALVAGSVSAATKRDVITDAAGICAGTITDANLQAACVLVFKTNGGQDLTTTGCNAVFDNVDNGVVDYLLRNCDRNEEALLRNASSVVLSLDDWLTRGKIQEKQTAAGYACSYADKYDLLIGAGKLSDGGADLASDAQNIASDLGFACP